MGKRFTATEKWTDKWFRALPPDQKLGWIYLCDSCDAAGVIELDRDLADFQIGFKVDWDTLIAHAGERIDGLPTGRLWLTRFVSYQYGRLSTGCKAHTPVFASLEKHNLTKEAFNGYPKAFQSLKEKEEEKEKDKDKDKDKEEGMQGGKPNPKVAAKQFQRPSLAEVTAYCLERKNKVDPEAFMDHYESNGWRVGKTAMKDWQATVRKWERNDYQPFGKDKKDGHHTNTTHRHVYHGD